MKGYTTFKHPYILIEDTKGKFQPIYKEYSGDLIYFNQNSPIIHCPFSNARRGDGHSKPKTSIIKKGYCEFCYQVYDDYDQHVNTKDHLEFAADDYNYRLIDLFIVEMLEDELYGINNVPQSPCDNLESKYSHRVGMNYDPSSDVESIIRMSKGSFSDQEDIVEFDLILNKINKKFKKGQ